MQGAIIITSCSYLNTVNHRWSRIPKTEDLMNMLILRPARSSTLPPRKIHEWASNKTTPSYTYIPSIHDLHILLSKVMSLLNRNYFMSCPMITSLQYFFSLPLPILKPSINNLPHLYFGAYISPLHIPKSSQFSPFAFSHHVPPQISIFLILC